MAEIPKIRIVNEKMPKEEILQGWVFIGHKHINNGEGHGFDPYDVVIYRDLNGDEHDVYVGYFNADDAQRRLIK